MFFVIILTQGNILTLSTFHLQLDISTYCQVLYTSPFSVTEIQTCRKMKPTNVLISINLLFFRTYDILIPLLALESMPQLF